MSMNSLIMKGLAVAVILLFMGMSVVPSTATVVEKKSTMSTNYDGNILYVGGDGPGNYTRIQDAIDDASDGDTVFVFNESSPYYEKIKVGKSISIVGEDRNTTVINGGTHNYATIFISTNYVNIEAFTIRGSVKIEANYNSISGNIISRTHGECIQIYSLSNAPDYHDNIINNNLLFSTIGITIVNSHNNIISNNKIEAGGPHYASISLHSSNNYIISGNIIRNSGIFFHRCNNNIIIENRISTSDYGIYLDAVTNSCFFNMITRNVIYSNDIGICLNKVRANIVFENNFLNNSRDVEVFGSQNHFIKNYWDRPRILPKLIFGYFWTGYIWIPWFDIDWRPALRPYDIPMGV